jgi:hypothetical protein
MRLANRLTAATSMGITVGWALALALAGSTEVLFFLAPALLILAPLVAGHYPGETLITRLADGRRSESGASFAPAPQELRSRVALLPRGPRLIALSLAKRPPPEAGLLHA